MQSTNGWDDTTIVEVGVSNGTLTIRRNSDGQGRYRYIANRNELNLRELFPEKFADEDDDDLLFNEDYGPVDQFSSALHLIDHYSWYKMIPLVLHPDFVSTVLAEVTRLGAPDDVQRWQAFLMDQDGRSEESTHSTNHPFVGYPDRKQRDLSDIEKAAIRQRLATGHEDTHALAREFGCASTQIAGIKAALKK